MTERNPQAVVLIINKIRLEIMKILVLWWPIDLTKGRAFNLCQEEFGTELWSVKMMLKPERTFCLECNHSRHHIFFPSLFASCFSAVWGQRSASWDARSDVTRSSHSAMEGWGFLYGWVRPRNAPLQAWMTIDLSKCHVSRWWIVGFSDVVVDFLALSLDASQLWRVCHGFARFCDVSGCVCSAVLPGGSGDPLVSG